MRFGRRVKARFYTGKKKKPKPILDLGIKQMMHEPVRDKSPSGIIRHYFTLEGERRKKK